MPGTSLGPLLGNPHGALGGSSPVLSRGNNAPRADPQPGHTPTPAPAPSPTPAPRQVEVRNPNVDAQIAAAMNGQTFRIASLFNQTMRPPKHDNGTDLCCSYHWRGKCSSGCGCSGSHHPLTKAECVRNLDFLQEYVETLGGVHLHWHLLLHPAAEKVAHHPNMYKPCQMTAGLTIFIPMFQHILHMTIKCLQLE